MRYSWDNAQNSPSPNQKKFLVYLFGSALLQRIKWIYALLEQSDNQN